MKDKLLELDDKLRLKKRALIESVNDILMSVQKMWIITPPPLAPECVSAYDGGINSLSFL